MPPGWTEFQALIGRSTYRFYDYTLYDDGLLRTHGHEPADHQTDVITSRSEDFVRRRSGPRPFLWTAYVAPHTGRPRDLGDPEGFSSAVPAPRHRNAFLGAPFPVARPSTRPTCPTSRRGSGAGAAWPVQVASMAEAWRQRRASLLAVDEGVARIVRALDETGELPARC